jgi:hypothetical protein
MHIPACSSGLKGRCRRALIAGTLLWICNPSRGLAEGPIAPTFDVSACDGRTRERLQWLFERADSREGHADLWWRGWIGFYGAGAVFQGTRAGFEDDEGQRADLIVSAAKAVGGVARLFFSRPVARLGADPLRAEALPDEESCLARVAQGEGLLHQAAQESERRWDWKPHLFNVAVNTAGALIVTQAFDQNSGWISAGIGIAVGKAMLWSHPWHGKSDLEDYEVRFAHALPSRTSWALMPYERGLRLQVRF